MARVDTGFVELDAVAVRLAEVRADAAGDRRHRVALEQELGGLLDLARADLAPGRPEWPRGPGSWRSSPACTSARRRRWSGSGSRRGRRRTARRPCAGSGRGCRGRGSTSSAAPGRGCRRRCPCSGSAARPPTRAACASSGVLLPDDLVAGDLGERGQGADPQPLLALLHVAQRRDRLEVDQQLGVAGMDVVLERAEQVRAAGDDGGLLPALG